MVNAMFTSDVMLRIIWNHAMQQFDATWSQHTVLLPSPLLYWHDGHGDAKHCVAKKQEALRTETMLRQVQCKLYL